MIFSFKQIKSLLTKKTEIDLLKKKVFTEYREELLKNEAWPWETGYIILKSLEGWHFRSAIQHYAPEHKNCEFGIDTGIISSLHLADIDFIDEGCEAAENVHLFSRHRYANINRCLIEDAPFSPNQFNNIYLIHVVDHIPQLEPALLKLNQLLRNGGKIYFSGLTHKFSGYYLTEFCAAGQIYNNEPLEWFHEIFDQYGFEVLHSTYFMSGVNETFFRFSYPFPNRTQTYNVFRNLHLRSRLFRFIYNLSIKNLTSALIQDDSYCASSKSGLNFMMVVEKKRNLSTHNPTMKI